MENLEDVGAKVLWCAVINQTFEDLTEAIAKKDTFEITTIRITIRSDWFKQICLMADVDYASVMKKFDAMFVEAA